MNIYSIVSKVYGLLDILYFNERGRNPRKIIKRFIPNKKIQILDMCCGTLCNTLDIAKENPRVEILGIDQSKDMLKIARNRIKSNRLKNVKLKCTDATNTALPDKSFDYIIIGLVLHECSPDLADGIIREAKRLLKENGSLIILEWEEQDSILRKLKFAPLNLLERVINKAFPDFYTMDKLKYFKQYGFNIQDICHCNYTIVLRLENK